MADANKSKLQLRSSVSTNSDKSPSPVTKLLLNHGKPNFTIPRSYKTQNGNANTTTSPTPTAGNSQNNNSNEFVVKSSTTFNGVFKPSNISAAAKQTLPQNGNGHTISRNGSNDNEAAKVVLRRPKVIQTEMREREDEDTVPEFIRRQRRIQERLANQNILDFENRRSGYFTQVMISPSSPNRKSFVETMASPAVKPGLEMPPPLVAQHENNQIETALKEQDVKQPEQEECQQAEIENSEETVSLEPTTANGQVEEEEVAKAIEEVNKAVEGEDDDKTELEDYNKDGLQGTEENERATAAAEEEIQPEKEATQLEETVVVEVSTKAPEGEATNASAAINASKVEETNSHAEEMHHENDLLREEEPATGITISHVNGINGPSIPAPDPSGEKGVNYEIKTVVSFSQELGNGDNKYPDTVKVIKDNEVSVDDSELKELTKLKFEIKADNQDIEVKPVLVNDSV